MRSLPQGSQHAVGDVNRKCTAAMETVCTVSCVSIQFGNFAPRNVMPSLPSAVSFFALSPLYRKGMNRIHFNTEGNILASWLKGKLFSTPFSYQCSSRFTRVYPAAFFFLLKCYEPCVHTEYWVWEGAVQFWCKLHQVIIQQLVHSLEKCLHCDLFPNVMENRGWV